MRTLRLLRELEVPVGARSVTCMTFPTKTGYAEPPNPGHPNDETQLQANVTEIDRSRARKGAKHDPHSHLDGNRFGKFLANAS